jgi:hypothetical protein
MNITEKVAYLKAILFVSQLPTEKVIELQKMIDEICKDVVADTIRAILTGFDDTEYKNNQDYKDKYFEIKRKLNYIDSNVLSIGEILTHNADEKTLRFLK